jgi:hypothetical protein
MTEGGDRVRLGERAKNEGGTREATPPRRTEESPFSQKRKKRKTPPQRQIVIFVISLTSFFHRGRTAVHRFFLTRF